MSRLSPPQELSFAETNSLAERWRMWAEEMRLYLDLTMKKDNNKDRCSAFLYIIGRAGRQVFNTWTLTADETDKIEALFERFDKYCKPKENTTLERYKFNSRLQKIDESLDEFVTNLRQLAKNCKFQNLEEEMVKDRIVVGIHSQSLKERLLREPDLTLEQAMTICRADEESRKGLTLMNGSDTATAVHAVRGKGYTDRKDDGKRNAQHRQMVREKQENCSRCGYRHQPRSCPAYGRTCNNCKGKNHFSNVCKKKKTIKEVNADSESEDEENGVYIGAIDNKRSKRNEWSMDMKTEHGNTIKVKLDTGAQANVLSEKTYRTLGTKLYKSTTRLTSYSGDPVPVIGETVVPCIHKKNRYKIKFIVTSSKAQNVLGLKTCSELQLIKRMESMSKDESVDQDLTTLYRDVFTGLGCLQGTYHIKVDPDVSPVHCSARKIPLSLQNRVKEELRRMEDMGVVVRQNDHTDWASPMVIVEKANKKLRLCMDPQQLNKAIKRDKFTIPDPEEIKAKLNKAKYFTKFDATSGFWHIPLDAESSKLCTMTTPFGKYSFLRCPFGISSAPEIFNKCVKQIYGNEEGIDSFFDDILVWGQTKEELRKREIRCLELARKADLRLNKEKTVFCQKEIKYLGHIISAEGSKPDPQKVEAIMNLKIQDKQSLQRYLGMVTYVGKYIPNLSQKTEILRRLLKKDTVWEWTPSHDEAVGKINSTIAQSPTLSHFDIDKEVTITCDASQYGLGAALLQEGNIIAYASKTLTDSERNYAQIEKEALSVVYACEKFHQFIYGRRVQIENDHKPLESIFKKSIAKCPPRIQRFMLKLQKYDIEYKYKPGKELVIADTLSRDPQEHADKTIASDVDLQVHSLINNLAISDEKLKAFKTATSEDHQLQELKNQIRNGWPEKRKQLDSQIVSAFWDVRSSLTCDQGLILKDEQIVVPVSLRKEMLKIVHEGHLGMEKCKRRARQMLYWPRMSAEIDEMVATCGKCLMYRNKPQREKLKWHETGQYPWQKVGADIFHLEGKNYLLIVDYLSKYVEIAQLHTMRSNTIISHCQSIFARHGIPEIMITDNAQNFVSNEFVNFTNRWEIQHTTSSPLYPQSNGLVERMVQTMKNLIKKTGEQDLHLALLNYRTTSSKDLPSPAEILMGRKLRTRLPENRIKLQTETSKIAKRNLRTRQEGNDRYDKGKYHKSLSVGDNVFMRNANDTHWQPAIVINKATEPRSYVVEHNNTTYRRNRNQLLKPNTANTYHHFESTENQPVNTETSITQDATDDGANNSTECIPYKPTRLQVKLQCSPTKQVQHEQRCLPAGTPSYRSNPQTTAIHYKTRSGREVQKPNKYTN